MAERIARYPSPIFLLQLGWTSLRRRLTWANITTVSTSAPCGSNSALTASGSERGDLKLAIQYFEAALRHGSPFEAYYHLAKIQATQMNLLPAFLKPGACSIAASFFKVVTERGSWDEDLIQEGEGAWETGTPSGKQLAMLKWWIAAERGVEIGQNNLAFILDQG